MKKIVLISVVLLLLVAGAVMRVRKSARIVARKAWPCMLSEEDREAAIRLWRTNGVWLTVIETHGVARKCEPVVSGVPLPEGEVTDVSDLILCANGKPVPCQFRVQSRWPECGSVKWLLLSFQATVAESNSTKYLLKTGRGNPQPANPVRAEQTGFGSVLDNGKLQLTVYMNQPGLMHGIKIDGRDLLSDGKPVQVVLVDASNRLFKASKPTLTTVEESGPMQATVLVKSQFVAESGEKIFDGKVGFDLWITAYAGKKAVRLDGRLTNLGAYGYRNERGRKREWLYMRSLSLCFPTPSGATLKVAGTNGWFDAGDRVVQRLSYPDYEITFRKGLEVPDEQELPYIVWPNMFARPRTGFFWENWKGTNVIYGAGVLPGLCEVAGSANFRLNLGVRRFSENFPAGFGQANDSVSFLMLPEGGYWPRTGEAYTNKTYQFEGGRFKTWELIAEFGDDISSEAVGAMLNAPLFAKAQRDWYGNTGAVVPMGREGLKPADPELREALERYERLQLAKVDVTQGDPAGPLGGSEDKQNMIRFGQVSVPWLWRAGPETFMGWMNYGDLVWGFGYCSLYYEWPYTMLQHYLRNGDPRFLSVGADMSRHRADIDQYHVENSETYLAGFQRYEKGHHGNMRRLDTGSSHWELNANPSHTWNRDLLLHWALTGNPRSLEAADQNGRAYARFLESNKNWWKTNCIEMNEFRTPGWGIEAFLGLYEYTGRTQWLAKAETVFDKVFLGMERKNGSRGHIVKDGRQDAQFVAYIVEPVCRLHHYTGRKDVIEFLARVLDWERDSCCSRGGEKNGKYRATKWKTGEWAEPAEESVFGASPVYSWMMADGYAYLYRVLGGRDRFDFSRQLFRESVFYYGGVADGNRNFRTPLGFHHLGTPVGMHAAKMHAFTGRYGQLYMVVEAQEKTSVQQDMERSVAR